MRKCVQNCTGFRVSCWIDLWPILGPKMNTTSSKYIFFATAEGGHFFDLFQGVKRIDKKGLRDIGPLPRSLRVGNSWARAPGVGSAGIGKQYKSSKLIILHAVGPKAQGIKRINKPFFKGFWLILFEWRRPTQADTARPPLLHGHGLDRRQWLLALGGVL